MWVISVLMILLIENVMFVNLHYLFSLFVQGLVTSLFVKQKPWQKNISILDKLLLKLHSDVSLAEGKTLMVNHYCFTFYIFFQVSIKYPNLKKKNSSKYTENLEVKSHCTKIEENS